MRHLEKGIYNRHVAIDRLDGVHANCMTYKNVVRPIIHKNMTLLTKNIATSTLLGFSLANIGLTGKNLSDKVKQLVSDFSRLSNPWQT